MKQTLCLESLSQRLGYTLIVTTAAATIAAVEATAAAAAVPPLPIKASPLFPSSATYIMLSGTATCQPVFGTGLLGGTAVTVLAPRLPLGCTH